MDFHNNNHFVQHHIFQAYERQTEGIKQTKNNNIHIKFLLGKKKAKRTRKIINDNHVK